MVYHSELGIKFKLSKKFIRSLACAGLLFSASSAAIAKSGGEEPVVQSSLSVADSFDFKPHPSLNTRLDYDYLDNVLENVVFYLGPSDRIRRVNRNKLNNGRQGVTVGHTSPYRMEGSRLYLKELPASFTKDIAAYREELQNLAVSLPITRLSRDEQLAFWFNLHNIAVLELMSTERRARYTSDKRYGPKNQPLHDVEFITIDGMNLSLRDIREKIVYKHWDDPSVIYGFYLGDISSPSLQTTAFSSDNLNAILKRNAEEYVNSLRGFEIHKGRAQISPLYEITAGFFFQDFETDLKRHFKSHMRPEIYQQVESLNSFYTAKYDHRIGSVGGGKSAGRISIQVTQSIDPNTREIHATAEDIAASTNALGFLIRDYAQKRERLEDLGLLESEVIIEDIETEDKP